jgi:hypothetical protein
VRRHLADCRECRAELDWLRPAVDTLPASAPQVEPPPELKTRVMEAVEREAELLRAAGESADRPAPPSPPRRSRWPLALAPRAGLALVAGCVVAVAVVAALLASSGGAGTRTVRAQITNPALSHVQASLRVRGSRAELQVEGLPAPAANHVQELWVKRGGSPAAPAGTFVLESGSVRVTRPVHRGDVVLVTVERGRGAAAPTTQPIMTVRV